MAAFEYRQAEEIRDCFLDDIIASKTATHRQKDIESLPRLRAFREYWLRKHGL